MWKGCTRAIGECLDPIHIVPAEPLVELRTDSALQRAVKKILRRSFAIHLLARGHDIRTGQELLGHRDGATTMVSTPASCGWDAKAYEVRSAYWKQEHWS